MTIATRSRSVVQRFTTGAVALALILSTLAVVEAVTATTADAVVPPVLNTVPSQVSADPLPTVQINGVVWDQEIVGNTVYVVGNFSQARPAGSPAGANQTARANVLAYNLTTGALIPGFVANTNNQVRTVDGVARWLPDLHRRPVHLGQRHDPVSHRGAQPHHRRGHHRLQRHREHHREGPRGHQHHGVRRRCVQLGRRRSRRRPAPSSPRSPRAPEPSRRGHRPPSANVETMLMSPDGSRLIVGGHLPAAQQPARLRDGGA